jgi:hypothetical protein
MEMTRWPGFRVTAAVGISGLLLAGLFGGAGAGTALAAPHTLYVSPLGNAGLDDSSCQTAAYSVIQSAVDAAPAGGTVVVCPGSYTFANQEGQQNQPIVLIDKRLTLMGQSATIDATGPTPATGAITGITDIASDVTITGFSITGAVDEGILAEPPAALGAAFEFPAAPVAPIDHVIVAGNTVQHVDKGFVEPFGCTLANEYPGDCGGAIHFNAVAHSRISSNTVNNNVEGILISDDAGPNFDNIIARNVALYNVIECGIVLPSHNPFAVNYAVDAGGGFHVTGRNPTQGGVYGNLVENNVSDFNGTAGFARNVAGSGSGVLIGVFGPGTGSYDNRIVGNSLSGNGLAGVVIHGHYPGGVDVSGNQVINNAIGTNNTAGDILDVPGTPQDFVTTGILVLSASPITMKIVGNRISQDVIGIWHNRAATIVGHNLYTGVTTPEFAPDGPFGSAYCVAVIFLPQPCPAAVAGHETLSGYVDPNGAATSYHFAYGTDPNNLSSVTPTADAGSAAGVVGVRATIGPLLAGKTYYFELVVTSGQTTVTGMELNFTT